MGKVLGALVGVLLCAACAPTVEVVPTPPPDPPGLTVQASGPCKVEEQVPEPVTETSAPSGDPAPGNAAPDVAPHHAENNAWKQRKSLPATGVQAGRDLIARVRPVLEPICASGDLSAGPVRKALAEHRAYVEQRPTLVVLLDGDPRATAGDVPERRHVSGRHPALRPGHHR